MLLLITHSGCGGAERMTLLYADILQRAGYDCRLLVLQKKGMDFSLRPFIPESLPFDLLQGAKIGLPVRIIKYVKRLRPDCIFDSLPIMMMALVRREVKRLLPDTKVVFRECNTPSHHTLLQLAFTRFSLGSVDAVISQTEEMKREMMKYYALPDERITVINNPVDESFIHEMAKEVHRFAEPDCIHYIAVGRVAPQKDYQTLLKAFSIVNNKKPESRLHILGDYSQEYKYKRELDNTIRKLNLEQVVYFDGFQTNPYKYIKAADVYVLSSVYEGLPNALQEALSLAIPVVATRCIEYISQVVRDDMNGYTVPVGDTDALADAMIKACSLQITEKFVNNGEREIQIIDLFNNLWNNDEHIVSVQKF